MKVNIANKIQNGLNIKCTYISTIVSPHVPSLSDLRISEIKLNVTYFKHMFYSKKNNK